MLVIRKPAGEPCATFDQQEEKQVPARYILIDYENVQPKDLKGLAGEQCKILLFHGISQTTKCGLAGEIHKFASRARYIEISGSGRNALDFHIAYYLGRLSIEEPEACFHIVSKDKGFDPLLKHLQEAGVNVTRMESIEEVLSRGPGNRKNPFQNGDQAKDPKQKNGSPKPILTIAEEFIRNLNQHPGSRPSCKTSLTNAICNHFRTQLVKGDVARVVKELEQRQFLSFDSKGKVSYARESKGTNEEG